MHQNRLRLIIKKYGTKEKAAERIGITPRRFDQILQSDVMTKTMRKLIDLLLKEEI